MCIRDSAKVNKKQNYAIVDGGIHQLVYYGQSMAMKHPYCHVLPEKQEGETMDWNLFGLSLIHIYFNSQTADMRIHYANQVQKKSFIRKSMDQNRSEIRHLQEKLADYRAQKAVFGSEKDAIRRQIDETEAQIAALTEEMTKSQAVLRQKTDERSKYAAEHKRCV